jgi:ATP-dependent exoDNAse (exonuclease V) beta subunit
VAATRARDRLYLAAELDARGRVRRGARSLASLLPESLTGVFSAAAGGSEPEVEWQAPGGTFAFRVCRPDPDAPAEPADALPASDAAASGLEPVGLALAPLVAPHAPAPLPATAVAVTAAPVIPWAERTVGADGGQERLLGTLVHRLFQRQLDPAGPEADLIETIVSLVDVADRVDLPDIQATASEALARYKAFREQPEVAAVLASGTSYHEVPFSFLPPDGDGACIRGSIDCLVAAPDGSLTILEFKTGQPRPEHQAQAALYARAVEAALGSGPVRAVVCYAD